MADVSVDASTDEEVEIEVETPEGGTTDEVEEYIAPTAEEWKATQEALKKANDEAKKFRLKAKEKPKAEVDPNDVEAQAIAKADEIWKPRFVKTSARAELTAAGVTSGIDRLLKLIDIDQVDVDDDGSVSGLEDQIESLKEDFPALFATEKPKRQRIAGDAESKPAEKKRASATERQLGNILSR